MDRTKVFSIIVGLVLVLAVSANVYAKDKPILIRCATDFAPMEPLPMILKTLENKIPKETNGRVKFELYAGGTLYNQVDAIVGLQTGALEMGIGGVMVSFFIKEWDIIAGLPLLFKDLSHFNQFLASPAYERLSVRMEKKGVKQLTKIYPYGIQGLFNSKNPIRNLEDLKNKKISVPPSKTLLKGISLLGAKAVSISIPELPAALETGMVDGSPGNFAMMPFFDLPRLTPYVTMVPINWFPLGLVVGTKWWNTVPNDLQIKLTEIFEDTLKEWGNRTMAYHKKNQSVYEKTPGTVISKLSEQEQTKWRIALKPLYDELKKSSDLKDIIETAENSR